MHRVDGRSYWFAGYFNPFDTDLMVRYAGRARAERFPETFGGRVPFGDARIVRVFDPDEVAARQFAQTFDVEVAATLEEFAEGLDAVVVPFPSGGPARDYAATAPLAQRGVPLFLDRIILEQSDQLRCICERAARQRVPLHVSSFVRYLGELLLPEAASTAQCVVASAAGEPDGYGADLLDLIDELIQARPESVTNLGDAKKDVLFIRYQDGRHAILQLFREIKVPTHVTALGSGWSRSLTLDGSQNHLGAFRQFEAFLRSLETREPPVAYGRVADDAFILLAAQRREFGRTFSVQTGERRNASN